MHDAGHHAATGLALPVAVLDAVQNGLISFGALASFCYSVVLLLRAAKELAQVLRERKPPERKP